jgi:hypothetical protein
MKRSILLYFCLVSLLPTALAQSASKPAQDDINLYYGSLRFIRAVHLHSLTAASPQETATIQYALRKELKISEGDYMILVREGAALDDSAASVQSISGKGTAAQASAGGVSKQSAVASA